MALDFPPSPTEGQTYTGSNGVEYRFDGVAWRTVGGGSAGGAGSWDSITNKPTAFPPTAHQHEISEINELDGRLNALQSSTSDVTVARLLAPTDIQLGYRLVIAAGGRIGYQAPVAAPEVPSPLHSGTAPPTNPESKPFWYDSTKGVLMLHYDDGTSAQWVPAVPLADTGTPPPGGGTPDPILPADAITDREGAYLVDREGNYIGPRLEDTSVGDVAMEVIFPALVSVVSVSQPGSLNSTLQEDTTAPVAVA